MSFQMHKLFTFNSFPCMGLMKFRRATENRCRTNEEEVSLMLALAEKQS